MSESMIEPRPDVPCGAYWRKGGSGIPLGTTYTLLFHILDSVGLGYIGRETLPCSPSFLLLRPASIM